MSYPIPSEDNKARGPFFIDSESCQCALQQFNQTDVVRGNKKTEEAWRCIGNANDNVYTGQNGKWFLPTNSADGSPADDIHQPTNWAGNPPNLQKTYVVDNKTKELQPMDDTNQSQLSILDNVCTGQNSSEQSPKYYQAQNDIDAGRTPVATLCYAGTQPVPLGNATYWQDHGCNLGFFCMLS